MRFALRTFTDNGNFLFYCYIGESKKRMYLLTADKDGKITGFRKFWKQNDEGYFLVYGDEN
jgi:hypothetical protein